MHRRRSRLLLETLECRTVPVAGALDPSFSDDGLAFAHLSAPFGADKAYGLVLQPDGKIVVAGNFGDINAPLLVRFNEDGTLDDTFGNDGSVYIAMLDGPAWFFKVVRQPDGKLGAAG